MSAVVIQADRERAEPFRRGTGGKYDRDHAALVQALAAHREAHTAGLVSALEAVNRLTSPGNRTFDEVIRDTGFACDIARAALAEHGK